MKAVGVFLIMITGYWLAEGMFSIPTILWFSLGLFMVMPEVFINLSKKLWERYEGK